MSRNLYTDPEEKTNEQLKEENYRLQLIADHDWLTGSTTRRPSILRMLLSSITGLRPVITGRGRRGWPGRCRKINP